MHLFNIPLLIIIITQGIKITLELLKGDRAGQHSIRINDQYRICFVWQDDELTEVEVVDYH